MDSNWYFYVIIASAFMAFAYVGLIYFDSIEIKKGFQRIGDMTGMTLNEISRVIKYKPKLRVTEGDKIFATWGAGSYSITIQFNSDEQFDTIKSEVERGQ